MKLNILTRSSARTRILGAGKVFRNTLRGLERIGVDVCINQPIASNRYNWIHDAPEGIIEAGFVGRPVLVGPNTAATPLDLPRFRRLLHPSSIYLFPSEWPLQAWKAVNFSECLLRVWPAGIDLERFPSRRRLFSDKDRILIYFKHRSEALLSQVISLVSGCGFEYNLVRYGNYDEEQYRAALENAKCAIWVGGTESQGFALMEALASGLPLLVLEANSLESNVYSPNNPLIPKFSSQFIATGASAAPYFDHSCGLITTVSGLTADLLKSFLIHIEEFNPANYVRESFSLEQCASQLVALAADIGDLDVRSQPLLSASAKMLRYLDLATRRWPWQLAFQRLFIKNS